MNGRKTHDKGVAMKCSARLTSLPPGSRRSCLVLFSLLALLGACLPAACRGPAYANQDIPPMLPPGYYQCLEAKPKELEAVYFSPYGLRWLADAMYLDLVFVFKGIAVDKQMLDFRGPDFIWVGQIKCRAKNQADVGRLRQGQVIDVVGINRGVPNMADMQFSLLMEDCYFLPAGSLSLPVEGGWQTFSASY